MKKVLVTGAAGFIPSKTVELLIDQGFYVVGVDNMNDYYDVSLKEYRLSTLSKSTNFEFHPIDIENYEALEGLFKKHDFGCIFNLAARAGVRYSLENPHVYMTTNGNGNLNLLELARHYKIEKFIIASTSSLYAGQAMPFVETLPVNEPISPYAATKKAAEVMCYTYNKLFNIDISIVRYFTVYGPAGRPDMSPFRFLSWIDRGEEIQLFGDGSQSRDFTYVDDIARGTILAMKKVGYEIFNLGGGNNPISINTMISMMEEKMGKKAKINNLPFHKADMKVTWANIEKAKKMLGWEPEINFEAGISRLVEDYLENRELYLKIKL